MAKTRILLDSLARLPEFRRLREVVDAGGVAAAGGLNAIHKAQLAAALAVADAQNGAQPFSDGEGDGRSPVAAVTPGVARPLFIITPDDVEARRVADDVAAFLAVPSTLLPPREFTFHDAEASSREWENQRIAALDALRGGAPICVASFEAATARTMPQDLFERLCVTVEVGQTVTLNSLSDALVASGYRFASQVEGEGQFSVRGGIVDVFSPGADNPVRIELWGDEVDTIAEFDVSSQRRVDTVKRAVILPAAETIAVGAAAVADALKRLADDSRKVGGMGSVGDAAGALVRVLDRDAERFGNGVAFPAADRWIDIIYKEFATALDYLPPNALVVICDHGRVGERAGGLDWQSGEDYRSLCDSGLLHPKHARFRLSLNDTYKRVSKFPLVYLDSFIGAAYPVRPRALETFQARQLPSYGGSLDTAISDVRHYRDGGAAVVLLCRDAGRARRLSEMLFEHGIAAALDFGLSRLPAAGRVTIALGTLSAGFEYSYLGLAVITEGQIMAVPSRVTKRGRSGRNRVRSYTDLTPGDYVVHEHHGIARFTGIVTMEVDGVKRDYIKLAFLGADALYIPATQLDLVSKYIGNSGEDGDTVVALSRLGGADWKNRKARAKAAVRELAEELIRLYAERRAATGHAFPEDDDMQTDFERRFEYDETDDQLSATAEIKSDMQAGFPMDRLLCGDVGFGKTEVALRGVMKCILAGKQAAILVPTTVLAQQHFLTATRRFAGLPLTVEVMSRFRTAAQQRKTLQAVAEGRVDLLIGTHRILQKDIRFKDLGLLVIDEEQRFGVTHKERLKEMSKSVDVLTLSATPIPRTLNMALSGMRDMSSLEDPPRDRHPVQTYVLEQDNNVVFDAIRRELSRGGQVYYLHNRVESIDVVAGRIRRALNGDDEGGASDADVSSGEPANRNHNGERRFTVEVGHGKMSETQLADVMSRMENGTINVLVCTTIIETGIDIPNVNTLIVEDADRYGLAQLHQLRGRVGRSQRHAYAYLCYRRGKVLSEIAEKRLTAIREFAEFGAGFKIAMRDLEIRGAGTVLGHAQSGHMTRIGYDMYLKLLEEAVAEQSGDEAAIRAVKAAECTADLLVNANIPEEYVVDSGQRMDLYRRIALVRTEEDATDLVDEICDRYGDMPGGAYALIRIARLRYEAGMKGVTEISQKNGRLLFALSSPDMRAVSELCANKRYRGRLYFSAGAETALTLKLKGDPLDEAESLVATLGVAN